MSTLAGVTGAFVILLALAAGSLKLGLLGVALCLFSAFAEGWLDHRRHEKAVEVRERLRAKRTGPQNWRG